MTTIPEYLTVTEVAAMLKVNKKTILRHIKLGSLNSCRIGRSIRIEPQQIIEFLNRTKGE